MICNKESRKKDQRKIIELLQKLVDDKNSDLRFGQLISNAMAEETIDLFYIKDVTLYRNIKFFVQD